ncbi:MAG: coproporphyrinogen dehydrogenase [Alphaproteobacteria bacterium]|nr:coproporphyrinogen dehydrogenase [Alphaproteobacteria bacterium]
MPGILDDLNLLRKYDAYAFDYIEYPHKSFWSDKVTDAEVREALDEVFLARPDEPVLLYLHIPFCQQLCWFCICHREITRDYERVRQYLDEVLLPEIDLLIAHCQARGIRPNIRQVYMGGGTPTYLNEADFDRLFERLAPILDTRRLDDFAIEVDPRRVDVERLRFYASRGINKISFGIQDFDPQVQEAVNRVQPPELIERLLTPEVRKAFPSINFDLLVGLPRQTTDSIRATVERTVAMRPDRISLAYVHYGPKFHPHQTQMNRQELLPDFFGRRRLFVEALKVLETSDYVRTGFEHFALPGDRVAQAVAEGTATYTSLGAVSGDCGTVIALGSASYSTIGQRFQVQWLYEREPYVAALKDGRFPVFRGHRLTDEDIVRRDLIKSLRTYFTLDIRAFEARHALDFASHFARELGVLAEFVQDGLVELSSDRLTLTPIGRHFANLTASVFDAYVTAPRFDANIPVRMTEAG